MQGLWQMPLLVGAAKAPPYILLLFSALHVSGLKRREWTFDVQRLKLPPTKKDFLFRSSVSELANSHLLQAAAEDLEPFPNKLGSSDYKLRFCCYCCCCFRGKKMDGSILGLMLLMLFSLFCSFPSYACVFVSLYM